MFSVNALTVAQSAVAPALLADRLGVDATDPMLPGLCLAATHAATEFMQRAITRTQYRATFYDWPRTGAAGRWISGGLGGDLAFIELPYTGDAVTVSSVTVDGDPVTDYTIQQGNPTRLVMAPAVPVTVEYTTGWPEVPPTVIEAVLMIAAYLYEHRGQCDAGSAVVMSGASFMLGPYRVISL